MRKHALAALGGLLLLACGGPPAPKNAASAGATDGNPLGPSYVLIPLPTEETTMLGRILPSVPQPGRSLEETSRANPCAAKLSEATTTPLASTFEDAQEVAASASAKAMLGTFGFSGDASRATHFVYKLETQKRAALRDTSEYDQCCKEKSCGYGYISALIYGEGEYATGEETSGAAGVQVAAVASASGSARVKILHKRKVKGWMAAVVTITDSKKTGEQLGPLGIAAAAGITEAGVPETVKVLYERDKLSVEGKGDSYRFKDGRGYEITENEFVRRYRDVTTLDDLDAYEQRRNKGSFYASGALLALSAGALTYGLLNLDKRCTSDDVKGTFPEQECAFTTGSSHLSGDVVGYDPQATRENGLGIGMAVGGGIGTIGFGIWFLVAALRYDQGPGDHYLSDRDAVLYSSKYNRALLRRTIKQVEKVHSARSDVQLRPEVGFGSLGFSGSF